MTFGTSERHRDIFLCLLLTGAVVGCHRDDAVEHTAPAICAAQSATGDGETLFRDLFFGNGAGVPELRTLHHAPLTHADANLAATENATIARLTARDPEFFVRFAAAMHSGDRVRVERALTDAGAAFAVAAGEAHYPMAQEPGGGLWWYHASYWFVYRPEPELANDGSRLYRQQLVDAIASALAPCRSASAAG